MTERFCVDAVLEPGYNSGMKIQDKDIPSLFQRKVCWLQGIFWTQELNQGLLHCRQILYQLSYQGIPSWSREKNKTHYTFTSHKEVSNSKL